jgi:DNA-directed RNA polymerase, mitochondrial
MRTKGSKLQTEVLKRTPLDRVYEGLNSLGKLPWCMNKPVLEACQEAWKRGMTVGELPSQVDLPLPPPTLVSKEEDPKEWYAHKTKVRKIKRKNSDFHSLRCDAKIKLGIAEQFKDDVFYFPYNMDFRGRAYPIPPNLNHLGSDMCRGMLQVICFFNT